MEAFGVRACHGAERGLPRQRGFTAMELVAALGIAALLATLAGPGFTALRRSAGLTSAANELLGALHLARSSAGRRGIPATVCLTANERTCLSRPPTGREALGSPDGAAIGWLVFHSEGAGAAAAQPASPDTVFHTFHLPPDIKVGGTRAAITFWPVARAGTTGTFELCDFDHRTPGKSIVVSQTGRPRVAVEVPSCG